MFQVTQSARTQFRFVFAFIFESEKKKLYRFNLYVYTHISSSSTRYLIVCAHSIPDCRCVLAANFIQEHKSFVEQTNAITRVQTHTHTSRNITHPYDKCLRIINGIHQPSLEWNSYGINIYRQLKQ